MGKDDDNDDTIEIKQTNQELNLQTSFPNSSLNSCSFPSIGVLVVVMVVMTAGMVTKFKRWTYKHGSQAQQWTLNSFSSCWGLDDDDADGDDDTAGMMTVFNLQTRFPNSELDSRSFLFLL